MANVTFQTVTPVSYVTLDAGTAYTVDPNGPSLYRKVDDSNRLSENAGVIEPESGATQCYVVGEARISITVAAA